MIVSIVAAVLTLTSGQANSRTFVLPHVLEVDGKRSGYLSSEGGSIYADVIEERTGAGGVVHKHIGIPKYEDFTVEFGMGASDSLNDWIENAVSGKSERKSGSIIPCDRQRAATSQEFKDALITEFGIPAMDAASKDAAKMRVVFSPESIQPVNGTGQCPSLNTRQKVWLPSNFRVSLGDLPTAKVKKIDALTWSMKVQEIRPANRIEALEPTKLEIPNLKLSVPQSDGATWWAWHKDFVVKGNNGQSQEKSGSIVLLDTDMWTPLAEVKLAQCGIYKIAPDKSVIKTIKIEMYCEEMAFKVYQSTVER